MTSFKVHLDKPDSNLDEILQAAEDIGALTYRWGLLDLIVIFRGQVEIWEVKPPGVKLREKQALLFKEMERNGYTPKIIRTIDDVVKALGDMGQ